MLTDLMKGTYLAPHLGQRGRHPYRGVMIIGLTRMTGGVVTIVFRKVSRQQVIYRRPRSDPEATITENARAQAAR